LIHAFHERLNNHAIPVALIVMKEEEPFGVISLKRETDPAFDDFPKDSMWMGSLHVLPEARDQGLG
jgi:hypothetical protein